MNELELAQDLIEGFKNLKEQDSKTIAVATNIQRPEFKNCDFSLLKKLLNNRNFNMEITKIDKSNFIKVSPIL